MSLCSDYALDAQIQKILFSLDLWVPKAARVSLIFFIIYLFVYKSSFLRKYKLIMFHNNNMLQLPSLDLIVLGWSLPIRIIFISYSFSRSPTRNDNIISNGNRLRRTLASRSMSAEVFHSSIDTGNSGSVWKNE